MQVFPGGQLWPEQVVLGTYPDALPNALRLCADVEPRNVYLTTADILQTGHHAQAGCFPCPIVAEESKYLPLFHGDAQAIYSIELLLWCTRTLAARLFLFTFRSRRNIRLDQIRTANGRHVGIALSTPFVFQPNVLVNVVAIRPSGAHSRATSKSTGPITWVAKEPKPLGSPRSLSAYLSKVPAGENSYKKHEVHWPNYLSHWYQMKIAIFRVRSHRARQARGVSLDVRIIVVVWVRGKRVPGVVQNGVQLTLVAGLVRIWVKDKACRSFLLKVRSNSAKCQWGKCTVHHPTPKRR